MCEAVDDIRKLISEIFVLIDNSEGVSGLHMNGDIAAWSEIRTGGRFEEWLAFLDDMYEKYGTED